MLGDYLGSDIGKIVNELEKLHLVMPRGSKTDNRPAGGNKILGSARTIIHTN